MTNHRSIRYVCRMPVQKLAMSRRIYFDEKAISFNYHTILLAADIAVSRKATISEGHSLISSLCTANRYAISFFFIPVLIYVKFITRLG